MYYFTKYYFLEFPDLKNKIRNITEYNLNYFLKRINYTLEHDKIYLIKLKNNNQFNEIYVSNQLFLFEMTQNELFKIK